MDKIPRRYAYPAAYLSGALLPIGFAPFDLWPLIVLSLLGWQHLLQHCEARIAFWRAWWFGLGVFTVGVCWVFVSIHAFGQASVFTASLVTLALSASLAFFYAVQGLLYRLLKLHRLPVLGASALWVVFEWVRLWLLTGFPWLYLGYAFIDTPLAGYAPLGSVLLMSFCICICIQLIYHGLLKIKTQPRISLYALSAIFGIIATGWILKPIAWSTQDQTQPIQVSLVQGNIAQSNKWDPDHLVFTQQMYKDLTLREWASGESDIVIWPEAAIPAIESQVRPYFEIMQDLAVRNRSHLISGLLFTREPIEDNQPLPPVYNGIFSFGLDRQVYAKQRLVPFGEYIPLYDLFYRILPFLRNFPRTGISAGQADQTGFNIKGFTFSPTICYEILYPNLVQALSQDAHILLTISNDAWFGRTHGPPQLLQMARMRALELNRYLLRATNNGITAIIKPDGTIEQTLPTDTRTVLRGTVYPSSGLTPFGRLGLWPILLICLGICLWVPCAVTDPMSARFSSSKV